MQICLDYQTFLYISLVGYVYLSMVYKCKMYGKYCGTEN